MTTLETTHSKSPSVLVIDDDEALRVLFRALLNRAGMTVECVHNGQEGLDRLATRQYDAIVLDLMMPVCSGFDVLRQFEATSPELLRKTIVTTGVNERLLAEIDRGSVYAIIRKPFDIDDLSETILKCVEQPVAPRPPARSRRRALATPEPIDPEGDLSALYAAANERFAARVPELRRLMKRAADSQEELMVRAELRRVMSELGSVFQQVAASGAGAEGFARLAKLANAMSDTPNSRHDH
ncbi:MAG TPA: response regulator [Thermoanaerobaculia bacterium]